MFRRDFLIKTGISSILVNHTGSLLAHEAVAGWKEKFDVIVIGSGFAGLAAAIEAAKNKASVLLIEKMDAFGGNSAICAGDMAVPGSPVQHACGIHGDSPKVMLEDLIRAGKNIDIEHAGTVCENALDTWKWTVEELGIDWIMDSVQDDWGQSFPRGIMLKTRNGAQIVQAQLDAAERLKVELRSGVYLEKLLTDSSGRVIGVRAREGYVFPHDNSGVVADIQARKGVVLATGGFSSDVGFREIQNPRLGAALPTSNHPGATAEALKLAMAIGAKTVDLEQIQVMSWNSGEEIFLGQSWAFIEYVTLPFGLWVSSRDGRPVATFKDSHRDRTEALLTETAEGYTVVAIITESLCRRSGFDFSEIASLRKQGIIHAYDSLSSLAEDFDIPEENLVSTVREKYKSKVGLKDKWLAILLVPKVHHCMGGLSINGKAQVRNQKTGLPIKGFYAAGEVCGGMFGGARLPSHSSTDALVMGRIAGKNAALSI